jgi:hypothetical protein
MDTPFPNYSLVCDDLPILFTINEVIVEICMKNTPFSVLIFWTFLFIVVH